MALVSIIIPAYNEERFIGQLLQRVVAVDLHSLLYKKEIIVVDDGSSDGTAQNIRDFQQKHKHVALLLLSHPHNKGKGSAIRTGIAHATGDIILIQDADLEYNPNEYVQLLRPFSDPSLSVVYGTRYLSIADDDKKSFFFKRKYKKSYFLAYLAGRIITWTTNLLYGAHITDEATCYKAFRAPVLKSLPLRCTGFEFCPEVTAKILKRGYNIVEVPISYDPRTYDEGKKINYKDGFEALWVLLKYRFID
ncbi:MAG: glycosyltransferase family 2 protein [Nanoarchaeota archaeon]